MAAVLFTPLNNLFGLVILPTNVYMIGLGLIFAPLLLMECSKAFGLTKHFREEQ